MTIVRSGRRAGSCRPTPGQHDGHGALPAQPNEEFDDLAAGLRVEVAGRLVGEKQPRLDHEGPRDGHPLLLPTGQLGRHRPLPAGVTDRTLDKPYVRDQKIDLLLRARRREQQWRPPPAVPRSGPTTTERSALTGPVPLARLSHRARVLMLSSDVSDSYCSAVFYMVITSF
jgi:hypothetical protein